MSYRCTVCDKKPVTGFAISHSHHGTKRRFSPNLQKVKIKTASGSKREYVCTRCLRSGKVRKAS